MAVTGIKRVRTGCWTCRRRGYRCDEGTPSCAECKRLGIECEGYSIRLTWMKGTSRIKNRGKVKVQSPNAVVPRSKTPKAKARLQSEPDSKQPYERTIGLMLYVSPSSLLSSKDQFLLSHYFYTVSGLLSSTPDRSINTYCSVILPMAMSSSLLLDTLLLVSTAHLACRYEQFALDLPRYRHRVLPTLISSIEKWHGFDIVLLATIIMMSINEVFEANPLNWVNHLKAVAQIISTHVPDCKNYDQETRMLLDIFAYHSVIAFVGTNEGFLVMEYYGQATWSALRGQNAFLASADQVISFVARLGELSLEISSNAEPKILTPSQLRRALELKASLENWEPPPGSHGDACNTVQAMRYSGLLYCQKIIANSFIVCGREEILSHCQAIVRHLGYISLESPSAASHMWPLYMAGSFLNNRTGIAHRESQDFIMGRLDALKLRRGVKTIDLIRDRLESIWNSDGDALANLPDVPLILI